jgi:translation initiation factor 5B
LLRTANVPFIVAVNKVDKIYGWKPYPELPINIALQKQSKDVQRLYETAIKDITLKFAENSLNSVLYYKNKDHKKWISLVPVSAKTGDGVSDLLMLAVQLTQNLMKKRLEIRPDVVEATVFDVRALEGLGPSIDALLIGKLSVGDTIALATLGGSITTTIKGLLTPKAMTEIRAKSVEFDSHNTIDGTLIVKILVHQRDFDINAVLPGTKIAVLPFRKGVTPSNKELELLKREASGDIQDIFKKLVKVGVYVHASTIGSLEALLSFLIDKCKIPVFAVSIFKAKDYIGDSVSRLYLITES